MRRGNSASRYTKKMKTKIMYVELKSHDGGHDDNGPAWITRVRFSKTGKSIYFREKRLQKWNASCGNYIDVDSGDIYWVSGPKKNGRDRYPWGGEKIQIDEEVREEYWTDVRNLPENINKRFV